jgi:hypothetical protein
MASVCDEHAADPIPLTGYALAPSEAAPAGVAFGTRRLHLKYCMSHVRSAKVLAQDVCSESSVT